MISDRRLFLQLASGLLGSTFCAKRGAQAREQAREQIQARATQPSGAKRIAMIVGNGVYPPPFDLPSVNAGASWLAEAMNRAGFEVDLALNLSIQDLRKQLNSFSTRVSALPSESVAMLYFAGHGVQFQSDNWLIGSGQQLENLHQQMREASVALQAELIEDFPVRTDCLSLLLVDACRTDITQSLKERDGLNQMLAPPGCIVCFSTKAGSPALAPINPDVPPFFTAELIQQLPTEPGPMSFRLWLQQTKIAVYERMRNHVVPAVRQLAQDPFIADNALTDMLIYPPRIEDTVTLDEEARWQAVTEAVWPVDILHGLKRYETDFPDGKYGALVPIYRYGAELALRALRRRDVKLYKSGFKLPEPTPTEEQLENLRRAARGDKDAAARVAQAYRRSSDNGFRFVGWLMYATALGNGLAAYDLALFYQTAGQPLLAAGARHEALSLGYTPPLALTHRR